MTESTPAPPSLATPKMARPRLPAWLATALLVLATLAVYWPATRCDFILLDDDVNVTANAQIQKGLSLEGIKGIFLTPIATLWQPLTMLSHAAVYQVFGLNPFGHHLVNVLLHALNAGLVFALLLRMTGATWRSLAVAALFAVHPLRVEAVAWVTERREVLSFSFGLLSLIAYARYAQAKASNQCSVISNQASGGRAADHGPRVRDHRSLSTDHRLLFYLLSLFFLALGLMSKPMLVTWPCVMLLLDYWPLRRLELSTLNPRPSTTLRLVKEKIPFFVLAALASLVTFVVQKHAGSLTAGESLTLGERVGNALISYCRYIGKLFWPADLTLYYPHPGHWPLGNVLLAGGLILGISVLLWMRQRRAPYLLMGWLWYCGTLVPVSQVIQTATQAMADRWTYVPSLGMLILTVWGVSEVTRKWRQQALALAVVGGGAVVLCGALTRHQLGYWKNSETLGRHTLKVTRNNYTVYRGLGDALNERGRLDEAVSHFREAVRLKPDDAIARWSLGAALVKYGQIDEAIGQLQEALRLNPNSATVHNALGIAFDKKGQPDKAMSEFETALRLNSDYAEAHYNLGIVRSRKGQPDEAIRQYQEAVRLDPKYAEAHNDLGIALGTKGRMDEAMVQFQAAIGCRPGYAEAHYNLGLALGLKGRTDEAIGQFEQALQAKPDYPEAHNYLGMALCQRGRASEGIRHFQEALRFRPGYADARRNLDAALAAKARTTQLPAAPNPPPP